MWEVWMFGKTFIALDHNVKGTVAFIVPDLSVQQEQIQGPISWCKKPFHVALSTLGGDPAGRTTARVAQAKTQHNLPCMCTHIYYWVYGQPPRPRYFYNAALERIKCLSHAEPRHDAFYCPVHHLNYAFRAYILHRNSDRVAHLPTSPTKKAVEFVSVSFNVSFKHALWHSGMWFVPVTEYDSSLV
ncbi:hypothetical protein BDK51DRAFT_30610 [Blyttiomyces helicus]|uniref:Uncharacterized protein n=1 Tax=Blyttiomyces helicus TaxID=388810 RepID=A0A4P9WJ84_9FUNG|nr:hypothetical protein BDK51DRAFT_30610 [Blyttiomyces helicus]|eukprot:RKO91993.1 hypothetical protein BDK51DRAFT_30610 [Blyttiomyces helicus]